MFQKITLLCASSFAFSCVAEIGEPHDDDTQFVQIQNGKNGKKAKLLSFQNESGASATFSEKVLKFKNQAFTEDFGTNARTCITCHDPAAGWTISSDFVSDLFDETDGLHPLFRLVDGANSPTADVSTVAARRDAYSMLLTKGLIRVELSVPDNAEFEVIAVDDPYGYATPERLSLFRRPLPATNLGFLNTVMWDGRVTGDINEALGNQANGATLGHAEALESLTQAERDEIVAFETSHSNAQQVDSVAGDLADGAMGGPANLFSQPFVAGLSNLYDGWADGTGNPSKKARREAIARGQDLFNTRVNGGGRTCQSCHDAENVGSNVAGAFFSVKVSLESFRTPDLPLYTLRNKTTGAIQTSSDPGRALITGLWQDVSRFKTPNLRGLVARAPFFHNGMSSDLAAVVDHYATNVGFSSFTEAEKADLVAFLEAL